ncbi:MAG: DUF2797 domain-containing protein [Candidatus Dojkabacteria bacterium]|nr:DUF2797 domain-containing protein [Candidatus Dojkabacteria bacterium]MDQ7021481.1 DUF2797 domain-containing protein [Candidatus Dojkabacteria bacterium]
MNNYQITNIGWRGNDKHSYYPILELKDSEKKDIPLKDYVFNFRLSEEKFCTGYYEFYDNGNYYPCPLNNKVESKTEDQCNFCESKFGFKSTFFYGKNPNESMRNFMKQDFLVYLTFFYPNIIKVGTTSAKRSGRRLIDQDALLYFFIAKGDAYQVLALEKYISKNFDIIERVSSRKKLKNIEFNNLSKKHHDLLISTYQSIYPKLKDKEKFKDMLYSPDNIAIVDFTKIDLLYFPDRKVNLMKDELILNGKFLGLRGKYLLLENDEQIFAFERNYLVGRKVVEYVEDWRYKVDEPEQLSLL